MILWAGGEDVDFPNGNTPNIATGAANFRSGYARCALWASWNAVLKSTLFPGGAITSAWLSFQAFVVANTVVNQRCVALGKSGGVSGIYVGTDSATSQKLAISKYDGTTTTQLAAESGTSIPGSGAMVRIDVNLANYGSSSTVTVYANGVQVITYSGSTAITGVSNLDSVFITLSVNGTVQWECSEIIVADEDTRTFALVTNAPNATGTTTQWTGAYTDINETTINDATLNYTNTANQNQQYNLIDLPSGTFSVKAVKIAARASKTSGSAPNNVGLGVLSGGTVDAGTAQAVTTGWATYERYMATNPVTSAAWTQSDVNALQLNLHSS